MIDQLEFTVRQHCAKELGYSCIKIVDKVQYGGGHAVLVRTSDNFTFGLLIDNCGVVCDDSIPEYHYWQSKGRYANDRIKS